MLGVLMWDTFDDARFQALQLVNIGDQYTANQHSKMGVDGVHNILCWKNVSKLDDDSCQPLYPSQQTGGSSEDFCLHALYLGLRP